MSWQDFLPRHKRCAIFMQSHNGKNEQRRRRLNMPMSKYLPKSHLAEPFSLPIRSNLALQPRHGSRLLVSRRRTSCVGVSSCQSHVLSHQGGVVRAWPARRSLAILGEHHNTIASDQQAVLMTPAFSCSYSLQTPWLSSAVCVSIPLRLRDLEFSFNTPEPSYSYFETIEMKSEVMTSTRYQIIEFQSKSRHIPNTMFSTS